MRRSILAMSLFALTCAIGARADGCYVPRIDPASHYRDIYEPDQKALIIYDGHEEDLIIQASYNGDVSEFVWLVPTPSVPKVTRCDAPVFHALHQGTAPNIRYWLDPYGTAENSFLFGASAVRHQRAAVEVIDRAKIGVYDIAVLRARDPNDLLLWLRGHGYMVARTAAPVLSDYVRRGWAFTAARISTADRQNSARRLREGLLEPLQFQFSTDRAVYPLRISSLNPGYTNLLLYVLSDHRMRGTGLRTVCALRGGEKLLLYPLDDPDPSVIDLLPRYAWACRFLTKLTADLRPEQMTGDVYLTAAAKDDGVPPKPVTAPFLENLGGAVLYIVAHVFWFPPAFNLAFLACVIIAATSLGRRRRGMWIVLALLSFTVMPIFIVPLPILALDEGPGYWPVSVLTITGLAAALVLAPTRTKRRAGKVVSDSRGPDGVSIRTDLRSGP